MALAFGDPILLASAFPQGGLSQPVQPTQGSGSFLPFGCGAAAFQMNSGNAMDTNPAQALEVAPGTSGLFGKHVQLSGAGPAFRGPVIAELQVELGSTGGTGALTECVLVQGEGFRFLARVTDVEEVTY